MSNKINTIKNWKSRGVLYNDFEELYYIYMNTLSCSHCNKDFKNSLDRCLDHDHETGLFRAIVCRGCNVCDRYIKYPNGYDKNKWCKEWRENNIEYNKDYYKNNKEYFKEYYENNKEKYKVNQKEYYENNREQKNKKYDCECGGKYTQQHKSQHFKSIKHTAWFMEQVD